MFLCVVYTKWGCVMAELYTNVLPLYTNARGGSCGYDMTISTCYLYVNLVPQVVDHRTEAGHVLGEVRRAALFDVHQRHTAVLGKQEGASAFRPKQCVESIGGEGLLHGGQPGLGLQSCSSSKLHTVHTICPPRLHWLV